MRADCNLPIHGFYNVRHHRVGVHRVHSDPVRGFKFPHARPRDYEGRRHEYAGFHPKGSDHGRVFRDHDNCANFHETTCRAQVPADPDLNDLCLYHFHDVYNC